MDGEGKGKSDTGDWRVGTGHGVGREGKGGKGGEGLVTPKLQFLAPPLHERRQSTRFTPDLDPHPFRKSWIRPCVRMLSGSC